ncbi:MAG: 30S ribosomal protein S8 [Candidatus Levybacteria bacterium]|nr:30S ribosomal protein S8 [Candidatus Levybacteria bacterium]
MIYSIGDFLIRIKNASLARRRVVTVPFSSLSESVGKVLQKEGFLEEIKTDDADGKKILVATLRFVRRKPVISGVKLISKPSIRSYIKAAEMGKKVRGSSVKILSTNQGILTGKEALSKRIGGEFLFEIW